jgi:hypothetical protein
MMYVMMIMAYRRTAAAFRLGRDCFSAIGSRFRIRGGLLGLAGRRLRGRSGLLR